MLKSAKRKKTARVKKNPEESAINQYKSYRNALLNEKIAMTKRKTK